MKAINRVERTHTQPHDRVFQNNTACPRQSYSRQYIVQNTIFGTCYLPTGVAVEPLWKEVTIVSVEVGVLQPYLQKSALKQGAETFSAVPLGIAVGVAGIVVMRRRGASRRYGQRRGAGAPARLPLDPAASPEERHVAAMQMTGYENPTYKYFESSAASAWAAASHVVDWDEPHPRACTCLSLCLYVCMCVLNVDVWCYVDFTQSRNGNAVISAKIFRTSCSLVFSARNRYWNVC